MRVTAILLLAVSTLSLACLASTPEDRTRDDLSNADHSPTGPTHRPGQPCLLCHGFEMAGTIYEFADDARGLEHVEVTVRDALGHEFTVPTNSEGTFLVRVRTGRSEPRIDVEDGEIKIPWPLEYPVEVSIAYDGVEQPMRSRMHRAKSCAHCHSEPAGATSEGRIYLRESP